MADFKFKKSGLFAAGVLFGTAGIKILTSKDAKKLYTGCTAAVLRAKDCIMKTATNLQENAEDIYAEAKEINEERAAAEEAVEDVETEAEETADEDAFKETAEETEEAAETDSSAESEDDLRILFDQAVEDAMIAEDGEILPVVSLDEGEPYAVYNEEGRVLLYTFHKYPDSYPDGTDVKLEWGNVWTFTGYTWEQIMNSKNDDFMRLLKATDVLVDGKFEKDKRSLELRFKGSTNQRTIDVPASLEKGEIVLWKDTNILDI